MNLVMVHFTARELWRLANSDTDGAHLTVSISVSTRWRRRRPMSMPMRRLGDMPMRRLEIHRGRPRGSRRRKVIGERQTPEVRPRRRRQLRGAVHGEWVRQAELLTCREKMTRLGENWGRSRKNERSGIGGAVRHAGWRRNLGWRGKECAVGVLHIRIGADLWEMRCSWLGECRVCQH
jgi:hypothetical protein